MASLEELEQGVIALQQEVLKRSIQFSGTFDPSDVGLAAPVTSLYSQKNVGNVEIARWKKVGLADTDWVPSDAGGGGGDAITGTWDITPTYVPGSFSPPGFVDPFGVTELANVITTDVASLTPGGDGTFQSVGVEFDMALNLPVSLTKSNRVRLKIADTVFDSNRRVIFGFIETALATTAGIRAAVDALLANTAQPAADFFLAFELHKNGGNIDRTAHYYSDGSSNSSVGTLGALAVGINNVDIHIARFEGTVISDPGNYHLFTSAMLNELPIATYGSRINMGSSLAKTLTPFIAVAVESQSAAIVGGDVSIEIDFTGAPVTLTPAQLDAPFPQPMIDELLGAPAAILGVEVPASITQVTTLPVGAAVNKIYKAFVNPAYTHGEHTVRPVANERFVRNGELVRITNITTENEAFEVINVWRDDAGGVHTALDNVLSFGDYDFLVTHKDDNTTSVPSAVGPDTWLMQPAFTQGQDHYGTVFGLNRTIKLDDRPLRFESKNVMLNNTVNSGEVNNAYPTGSNALVVSYANNDNTAITIGTDELYIQAVDYNFWSGLDPNVSPGYVVRGFNEALAHNTVITRVSYKLYLDAACTIAVGTNISLTTVSGTTSAYVVYIDAVNNYVYTTVQTPSSWGTNLPITGSWATGNETVNITEVRLVAILDKNAIATIDSGNPFGNYVYLAQDNSSSMAITSSPDFGVAAKSLIDQTAFDLIGQNKNVENYRSIQITTLNRDQGGYAFVTWGGAVPYRLDGIMIAIARAVAGTIVDAAYCVIYPKLIDGYDLKPDTQVAYDILATDILIRYINSNDDEVTVSLNAALASGLNNIVMHQFVTPAAVITVNTGNGVFTTGAVLAQVAWYPQQHTWEAGIKGRNAPAPVYYTRGVDFDITANNEITISATFPSEPGYLQIIVDEMGSGFRVFNLAGPITDVGPFITAMSADPAIISFVVGAITTTVKLDSFERPNPAVITAASSPYAYTSPTRGELFTVDEDYNPTLSQPMAYQVKNALAKVSKSGTYNGYEFLAGNFARWDGYETVPFPMLPIPDAAELLKRPAVHVTLTATGVNNVDRFDSLKDALQYIFNRGKVGSITVEGNHDVYYSHFFSYLDQTCRIGIRGSNYSVTGTRDILTFHHAAFFESSVDNKFFRNFKPYLEDIQINNVATNSGGGIVRSVFEFTNGGGAVWNIGSNVLLTHNTGYNGSSWRCIVHVNSVTGFRLKFDKNLELVCTDSSLESGPICLSDATLEITGSGLNTSNSSYTPINIRNLVSSSQWQAIDSEGDSSKFKDWGWQYYRHGTQSNFKLRDEYLFNAVVNSRTLLDTTPNAITVILTQDFTTLATKVGDEILFEDYANNFATNNLTIDPDIFTIDGSGTPVVYNVNGQTVRLVYMGGGNWKSKVV
jgi:hypothetical protein